MAKERTYFCIDMKSFYASVECVERGLDPFETNLVVADATRGPGSICLAISPKLKTLGVRNRCRLFEIPKDIEYITAKPRMKKYIEYCADIYEIYLRYIAPEDIHIYSIDECFIDATDYLSVYKLSAKEFATKLVTEILGEKGITATVGIGTNLYLAKIALDITAKRTPDRMGYLDEELFKKTLWNHRPITDFWNIAKGIATRLERYGIYDMEGIARCPEELLYKEFGINAELIIDHAHGRESCTMADIKSYKSKAHSISNSQILFSDYTFEQAKVVLQEMVLSGCQQLMKRKSVTNHIGITIGYSNEAIKATGGRTRTAETTNSYNILIGYAEKLYDETTHKDKLIRKLTVNFDNLADESQEEYDLFTDYDAIRKEKSAESAVLELKDKFGKNIILRAVDLTEYATQRVRNKLIGGHNG